MNFYGPKTTDQHTLAGRLIPLGEAMILAVAKASGQNVKEQNYSKVLPDWTHNLCDKITTTIFKSLVEIAPRNNIINAHNYGCMIGIMIRGLIFYVKEAPELLKKDGLMNLTAEQETKLEKLAGLPLLFSVVSDFLKKPISDSNSLFELGIDRMGKKAGEIVGHFGQMIQYLLNRPIEEQSEFLNGIAKGFKAFLNPNGDFTGDKRRWEVYLALFTYWPEIVEMQNAQPPKTRKDLLEWLEKQEEKQFFEDPKNFYSLCEEIDLDMTTPGHPAKN